MKKLSLLASVSAALVCASMPVSLNWSPASLTLFSPDTAEAEVGRPLTATSVAGVNRRVHRREYRRAATGAAIGAAAVGAAAGADVGVPVPAPEQVDVGVPPSRVALRSPGLEGWCREERFSEPVGDSRDTPAVDVSFEVYGILAV
jgi:hypothetical protein